MMRLFVAVEVSAPVRERLGRVQRELDTGEAIRWTPGEQMHLTLRFLGDVEPGAVGELAAALRRACAGKTSFELEARGLGVFPDLRRPRVVWAGVNGDVGALRTLQAEVLQETADWGELDGREFSPHLTIGRVREGRRLPGLGDRLEGMATENFGKWRVNAVRLMRSELGVDGAQYTELGAVGLKE